MGRLCRNTQKNKPIGRVRVMGARSTVHAMEGNCLSREKGMNAESEIISVRRLRSTHTSLESWGRLPPNSRTLGQSMGDDASRFGLRRVGELSETTRLHRIRERIGRGIVWQAAYRVLADPERLAALLCNSPKPRLTEPGGFLSRALQSHSSGSATAATLS